MQVIVEMLCAVASTVLIAWQAGYFMNVSPGETGFGMYRMNLLALFDPSGFDAKNWSKSFEHILEPKKAEISFCLLLRLHVNG